MSVVRCDPRALGQAASLPVPSLNASVNFTEGSVWPSVLSDYIVLSLTSPKTSVPMSNTGEEGAFIR